MPTIQQLPQAVSVNVTDEVMLDQSGVSVAATVAQVLAAATTTVTLTGDVTGTGTGTIVTTLAPVATPGTYAKVSVNAKGQVTGGGAMAAADVVGALGFTPYSAANPAGYVAGGALGSIAGQQASAVAITGGSVAGADVSGASVLASGTSTARTLAARAAGRVDVLDFGADPTGAADSAPAFAAAMAAVPAGAWGRVEVPPGTYKLNSFLNQPAGRSIAFEFHEGAVTTGPGGLGVDRVESRQGPYTQWTGGGGWFGFSPTVGAAQNPAFHTDVVQNTPANSGSSRVAWSRNYSNYNYYGKYVAGIDIAEQNIYSWPHLYDNSSGWGHWEVIFGTTYDEDSAQRAHLTASAEHSEFDVVNNGPEAGWTWRSGLGNGVQGMSIDPWGQNGQYGGGLLFAYGSVGSFDGQTGGLNWRWPSYPAVFSNGNPPSVGQNSTIVITFDLTAKASATLSGGGVASVAVSNGGGVYSSAPTVVFTGGGGSGAAGSAVMLGGAVVGVTMTAAGSGYASAPQVSFTGGGVAAPVATTVTLNPDGAHGDLGSVASAINAANIPNARAAVAHWGGIVDRLVVFGTAGFDLGTLTLGGTALAGLGVAAQAYSTPRDTTVVVFGGTGGALATDQLTLNGTTVTIGGAGALSDVVAAINRANIVGIKADITASSATTAGGRLVLTCWVPQNPGGLVVSQPAGFNTLGKLGLSAGTFWPPTPPKGFATVYGELAAPVCHVTDQISISATDLNNAAYGPVTVTLNGGAGTGWVADVAASIQAAITAAGFHSTASAMLTAPPAVVTVTTYGSGGDQGLVIRNTAGGTLTLANVTGTPLQTLGITPGTYQPGGYSAASQSVFMAAEDSIAPQGRGIFLGGARTATDRTVWPHAPLEARGSFLHGLRTDKAVFDDNTALLLGSTQAIGFGAGAGALSVTASGGALAVNGAPVALAAAVPTRVSQLANDAGYVAAGGTVSGSLTVTGAASAASVTAASVTAGAAGSFATLSQAGDVGGYHPIVVAASGGNVNVPLVLAPAGAGYIAAALSDGTALGGNQRGQFAVDVQQARDAGAEVASGAYAAIPGGRANTAGGTYSLAAGQGSTATGQGSVALGQYANDGGAYGKLVFSGNAGTVGNQFGVSTLFVSSVVAASRMTADGNPAGPANSLPIRANRVIAGTLSVAARCVTTGDAASWNIPVLFKNSAGTVSVTSPGAAGIAPTVSDASLATASIAIAADNANKGLSVTISPPASMTLSASAVFLATEM